MNDDFMPIVMMMKIKFILNLNSQIKSRRVLILIIETRGVFSFPIYSARRRC